MSPLLSVVAADSWTERLFLIQLSKSPDVLEATANVLLEVKAPLDGISWFKGIVNMLRCGSKYTYSTVVIQKYSHIHALYTYGYAWTHAHVDADVHL